MAKSIRYTYEEFLNKMNEDLQGEYQIGLHEIGVFGTEESKKAVRKNNPITYFRKIKPKDYCGSILNSGLKNRWEEIGHTLYKLGSLEKINEQPDRKRAFLQYKYEGENGFFITSPNDDLYDIIVAMPKEIMMDNKHYLLGYLDIGIYGDIHDPEEDAGKRIFYKSDIPKEFIYGYIHKHNGIIDFTPNERYIDLLSPDEQKEFYQNLIKEKKLMPTNQEKANTQNKSNKKLSVLDALKIKKINEQQAVLELLNEKENLEKETGMIPYKKFNFFDKHFFKRREFKEYMSERKNAGQKNQESKRRIKEIEKILYANGKRPTIQSVSEKIAELQKASTIDELGITDVSKEIANLINDGVEFKFESCKQALELAPDIFSENIEFMKKAIKEDLQLIKYDKTNSEDLYHEVVSIRIEELKGKNPNEIVNNSHDMAITELDKLMKIKKELESPKQVPEGKYKVPRKYLIEEIKNNIANNEGKYWYCRVDGIYDIEFGKEMESLYENPDCLIGIHGLSENKDIEKAIFREGLKNSMQNATTTLNRIVAYGSALPFTQLLNFRIPYNGIETESAIILTLPTNTLDANNPVPIWGSHDKTGDDNYILPQYIYGVYHAKSDGENRRVIRNKHENEVQYEYLKYDELSGKRSQVVENEKEQNR